MGDHIQGGNGMTEEKAKAANSLQASTAASAEPAEVCHNETGDRSGRGRLLLESAAVGPCKEDRRKRLELRVAVAALVLNFLTLGFLGIQSRAMVQQTKQMVKQGDEMSKQSRQLSRQTEISGENLHLSAVAEKLSFNLALMERNDDVLRQAARDKKCYKYVWEGFKPGIPNASPEVCGDSVLDVLEMATASVDQLPGASGASNRKDWCEWTSYVLTNSANLRRRVVDNKDWWPELTSLARRIDTTSARSRATTDFCSTKSNAGS
jgi:hypothetical protein